MDPQIGEDWLPTVAVINRVAEAGRVNNGQLQVVPKKDGVGLHSDRRLQTLGRLQAINVGREKGFDQLPRTRYFSLHFTATRPDFEKGCEHRQGSASARLKTTEGRRAGA